MNKALFKDLRLLKSFVTLLCADWDPETSTLTYASAGHCMPLHLKSRENEVKVLPKVPGIMVGGIQNQTYKEETVVLENEDTVFFYTDGIIEAVNKQGEQFKHDRLVQTLTMNIDKLVKEIEVSVMKTLHTFTEGTYQKDDITMVVLKIQKEKK
jgi:serine phosphatase RsbU (regulator of sigma subunit)